MMRFLSLLMVVGLSQCAFGDTSGYNFYLLTEKEEIPLVNVELLGEQQIKNQIAAVFTTLDEHDDAVQSKIIEAYKLSGDTSVIVSISYSVLLFECKYPAMYTFPLNLFRFSVTRSCKSIQVSFFGFINCILI